MPLPVSVREESSAVISRSNAEVSPSDGAFHVNTGVVSAPSMTANSRPTILLSAFTHTFEENTGSSETSPSADPILSSASATASSNC